MQSLLSDRVNTGYKQPLTCEGQGQMPWRYIVRRLSSMTFQRDRDGQRGRAVRP